MANKELEIKSFFQELFTYNQYCNEQMIEVCSQNTALLSERLQQLFSHILNAHRIWNNRILSSLPVFSVWELHSSDTWESIALLNYKRSMEILERFELTHLVNYTNSAGQPFTNTVQEILFQIINHSTYHRAQIATELKNLGFQPPATDYIFYKR